MPSAANLTRAVAEHRSATVELADHAIHLDLTGAPDSTQSTFTSTSTITLVSSESSVEIDLVAVGEPQVELDGERARATYADSRVRVEGLTPGREHTVTITAQCVYGHTGEGLHRYHDPEDGETYLYTHFEPTDARRVFACFDQPDLKAPFRISVSAPTGWLVRSNAEAEHSASEGAVTTTDFAPTLPISTYIVCVIAGPYHLVEDEWVSDDGRRVPLSLMCRPAMASRLPSADLLRWTKAGLPWCEERFGREYPWGKYEQIFVPEYNIGAMENPGLVTFNERYLKRGDATRSEREALANTLLHEMAHMWFGDLVTMPWWDDLWLKESFADFIGTQASEEVTEFADAWVTFGLGRKMWAYSADQLPTTHPIVADIPDVEAARANFDGITYAKGASVLRQLVAYVGEDAFYAGASAYFADHAFANASLTDFLTALSTASGRDMGAWAQAWLRTAGPDTLSVDGGELVRESLDWSADEPPASPAARPHRLQVTSFSVTDDGWTPLDSEWIDVTDARTPLPNTGAVTLVDDHDWTYARIVPDAATFDALTGHLAALEPTNSRAVAWGQLWHACRDAHLPTQTFCRTVLGHIPAERSPAVVDGVCLKYVTAVTAYLPTSMRTEWGDALWRVARDAYTSALDGDLYDAFAQPTARLDLALAWRRVLTWAAGIAPAAQHEVRAMLDGPDGLFHPDADERWALLVSRAAHAGEHEVDEVRAELDRELERDTTKRGIAQAIAVRAALATPQAKLTAWERTDDESLTNEEVAALVAGLTHPASVHCAQSVDLQARYLDSLERWWNGRSQVIASKLARGLFGVVTDAGAAQAWLDAHVEAPGALRRIVVEEVDQLRRAERARENASAAASV